MLYFFAIVGSQETNAAAIKTLYELQKLNRIVARVENTIPPTGSPVSVMVIGSIDNIDSDRLRTYPNKVYRPHFHTGAFASYRHVPILNFVLGRTLVKWPTKDQVKAALASAKDREPWPSPESVYMQDGVLVVLLSRYKAGIVTTRSASGR